MNKDEIKPNSKVLIDYKDNRATYEYKEEIKYDDNLKSIEQQVNLVLGKTNKLLKNEIINPTYFISRTKTE